MKIFFLALFSLFIVWAAMIGLDGDAFTYYLAISFYAIGILGIIATLLFKRICSQWCK